MNVFPAKRFLPRKIPTIQQFLKVIKLYATDVKVDWKLPYSKTVCGEILGGRSVNPTCSHYHNVGCVPHALITIMLTCVTVLWVRCRHSTGSG